MVGTVSTDWWAQSVIKGEHPSVHCFSENVSNQYSISTEWWVESVLNGGHIQYRMVSTGVLKWWASVSTEWWT